MIRPRLFYWLLLASLFFVPRSASADDPKPVRLDVTVKEADASLDTEWFGIYMENKKIGYFSVSRSKVTAAGGRTFYREKSTFSMKLQSMGQKTELKTDQVQDFDSKPPFRLLRAEYQHVDDNVTKKIMLAAKDQGYEATLSARQAELAPAGCTTWIPLGPRHRWREPGMKVRSFSRIS